MHSSHKRGAEKLRSYFLLLFLPLSLLFALFFLELSKQEGFVSSEVRFTDHSKSGMRIVPASCASSPTYFHSALSPTADGKGYSVAPSSGDYTDSGAYAANAGAYVCVISNLSGNTYFIPANTAEELQTFKSNPPAGVTVY